VVSGQKQTRTEEFHRVFRSGYEGDDFYGFASYQDYSAYLDDTRAYDGKRSLRLATNTVWGGPIYGIRVNAGDIVSFEGYTYFEGGPGTTGGEFICKVFDEVSTNEVNVWTKDFSSHNTIAGSWQKAYINNYVVPAVGGSNRVLYMTIKPLAYGHQQTTWFDNLKVVIKSPTRTETVAVADIITLTNYYAFGMAMPGRTICNSEQYRYGFNGMEKDDDWYGAGNEYTTEFRQLDVRTGRWMSMDPMFRKAPDWSPYRSFFNNPIYWRDPSGLFESRKEARQHRRDHKLEGTIKKDKDGLFSIHDKSGDYKTTNRPESGVTLVLIMKRSGGDKPGLGKQAGAFLRRTWGSVDKVAGSIGSTLEKADQVFYSLKGSSSNEMTLKEGVPYMVAGATLPMSGAGLGYSVVTGASVRIITLETIALAAAVDDVTSTNQGTLLERSTGSPEKVKMVKLALSTINFTRGAFNLQEIIMRNNRDVLEIGINTVNLVGDLSTVGDTGSGLLINYLNEE